MVENQSKQQVSTLCYSKQAQSYHLYTSEFQDEIHSGHRFKSLS